MTRFSIHRRLRLVFIWGAAFALLLALRFESDYRDRVNHLAPVVDEHGNTASLEVVMANMDSYEQAKKFRKLGFISLGAGILLCTGAALTKTKSEGNDSPVTLLKTEK